MTLPFGMMSCSLTPCVRQVTPVTAHQVPRFLSSERSEVCVLMRSEASRMRMYLCVVATRLSVSFLSPSLSNKARYSPWKFGSYNNEMNSALRGVSR